MITVNNLPLISEAEKQSFIDLFVEKMGSGDCDVFEMYVQIKQLDSLFSDLVKNQRVKDILDAELKNENPRVNRFGFVIEKASKSTYEYDNDSVHVSMKEALKKREALLKALPDTGMADPETGEMLYPPLRKVSEHLKLTNKNK